jgi:hypothetical protein
MTAPVPLDPARNPAYLKLDLYCKGMRLHESCQATDDGGRPLLRTRAGLGSGLELILPGNLWTNVPVLERFARESPYELRREATAAGHAYRIWRDGTPCARVELAPLPRWYDARTSTGKPMRLVGTLQGTYLGIYPGKVCDFWMPGALRETRENCHFCSVGLNLGADDAPTKSVRDVVEVAQAAQRESGITYVDFNMGHHDLYDHLDMLEPFVVAVKRATGLLVGVQVPPHPELTRYRRLRNLGVNRISFCFELFDPACFAATCPGKARVYGLPRYLSAIEYCASLGRPGEVTLEPWVTNGELIAGLEQPAASIEAIRWLTARGAIPTACVFRPLRGTDMADASPPDTEAMVPVFQELWIRCMEAGLPIGVAPNVHVSLVLLPEECKMLVQDEATLRRFRRQEAALAVKRSAFAALFLGRTALARALA